jgi:hypothetical protein
MYFENLLLHFSCLIIFPIVGVMIFLQESSARISRSVSNSLACELKTRRICVSSEGEGPSSNGFPVCVGSYGGVSKAWPGKIHWCEQFFENLLATAKIPPAVNQVSYILIPSSHSLLFFFFFFFSAAI